MRAYHLVICLAIAVAVAGGSSPARAQGFELTPYFGYSSVDYDYEQGLVCLAIFRDCVVRGEADDTAAFGMIFGFDLRPGWQLEVLANRRQSDLDVRGRFISVSPGVPDQVVEEDLDFELTHLQIGASRTFGAGPARPFVAAALGGSRLEIDDGEIDPLLLHRSDDALSASAGGGVKVDLSPRFGLRLEGRAFWVDLEEEAGGELIQLDAAAGLTVRW